MKPDSVRASLLADLPDEQEAQVLGILEEYLGELECGGRPSPEDWIAQHPDLEDVLRAYLRELDQLHQAGLPRSFPAGENPAARVNGERGRLGDFQIIREVGRGGMGVVYEAQQLSLDRRVALKVLPFAATLDARQLKRFKNEAQAAAQLHHNQIVPVYAVGCDRGVHYYAMQFIDGQSLAEIIHELRELSPPHPGEQREARSEGARPAGAVGNPTTSIHSTVEARTGIVTPGSSMLDPRSSTFYRAAAELMVQAALALEHAHQLGVVHRDIKPANLLVDGSGNLWITDFGLARGRTEQGLTRSEDLVGTLRYMSPEQALAKRGLVDHRTDIYSLGVTLYETLTLEPAYAGSDRDDLLRQIAMCAPWPPRRLRPSVPFALETIVLKAIAREPERRYASAQDLADDLQRFLDNRPIRAVRPTLWERLSKWCGRHKPILMAAAVLGTLAAVGLIACTILIWREKEAAMASAVEAENQRQRAEANFSQALFGAWELLQPLEDARLDDNDPKARALRLELVERGAKFFQAFVHEESNDPIVRFESARACELLASVYCAHQQVASAQDMARRAVKLYEPLAADDPSKTVYRQSAAAVYYSMGILYSSIKQPGLAEQEWARAIEQCRLALPHDEHGEITNNLAWYLVDCPAEALRSPAEAVGLARKAVTRAPAMGDFWNTLGVAHYRAGEFQSAVSALSRSVELRSGGDGADYFFLAMAYERLGDRKQSRVWYDKGVQGMDKRFPQREADIRYRAEAKDILGIKE
jgi:serine/threonine protein kinase/tetratricopeptide (TPR) repeat protein